MARFCPCFTRRGLWAPPQSNLGVPGSLSRAWLRRAHWGGQAPEQAPRERATLLPHSPGLPFFILASPLKRLLPPVCVCRKGRGDQGLGPFPAGLMWQPVTAWSGQPLSLWLEQRWPRCRSSLCTPRASPGARPPEHRSQPALDLPPGCAADWAGPLPMKPAERSPLANCARGRLRSSKSAQSRPGC